MRTRTLRAALVVMAVVGTVAALLLVGYVDTAHPRLVRHEIVLASLDAPVDVLFAADLHGARFGERQERIAKLLADERFDAVILGGDYVGTRSSISRIGRLAVTPATLDPEPAYALLDVLVALSDRPVHFVRGNHDTLEVLDGLARQGAEEITESVDIAGIRFAIDPEAVASGAATGTPEAAPAVLVTHIPPTSGDLEAYADAGITVVLAAHTHGGQIAMPLAGPVWAPLPTDAFDGWFPGLRGVQTSGVRERDGITVLITRGLGAIDVPLRLFSRAELVHVRFVPEG